MNEFYYTITANGQIERHFQDDFKFVIDIKKEIGNYFETTKEAQECVAYLRARAIIKKDAKGFKPNWKNPSQKRFFGYFNLIDETLCYFNAGENMESKIFFKTEEDIKESFKKHQKEWMEYLSYKQ